MYLKQESKGARHIHMVLESIEPKAIKRCWDRGTNRYSGYLMVQASTGKLACLSSKRKRTVKKMEKYGGKTYSPIKKPETATLSRKNVIWERDFFRDRCKESKKVTISTKDTMKRTAVYVKDSTATGYPYMEYILVQNGHRSWYIDDGG